MKVNKALCITFLAWLAVSLGAPAVASAQGRVGEEHGVSIYGVEIGMDVPAALQAVFINANRKPGEERPDARRSEGKDKKDVRVVYKSLPAGEMQILFADGKYVKEILLIYADQRSVEDLRLPNSSSMGEFSSGARLDDRYTVGFVDNKKQEKLWWRDEKRDAGYQVRLMFLSGNLLRDATLWWQKVVQKTVSIKPGDEEKFRRAVGGE